MAYKRAIDRHAHAWLRTALNVPNHGQREHAVSRRRAAVIAMMCRQLRHSTITGANLAMSAAMIDVDFDEALYGLGELERLGLLIDSDGRDFRLAFGGTDIEQLDNETLALLGTSKIWESAGGAGNA